MGDQELNIKLVEAVEKHEVLYNYTLPGYSRKDVTEKAWKEVSDEVDMPVQDCKYKWRNLRTVFMRKMKPSPSGSRGKKRAYYLENLMQFCLPFIKTAIPPSTDYLHAPPSTIQPSTCDTEGYHNQVEDSIQLEVESTMQINSPSISPSVIEDSPQHHIETPSASSSPKRTSKIREKNYKNSVADQSVAEYFKPRKAKLPSNIQVNTDNQKIDRHQGIKMFLLSLIPELEELSDSQIRLFKRQVLRVIDDISL